MTREEQERKERTVARMTGAKVALVVRDADGDIVALDMVGTSGERFQARLGPVEGWLEVPAP